MSRYSDMNFYSNLSSRRGVKLIAKSIEKHNESRQYQLYAQAYGNMTPETFMSFEEFYKPASKQSKQVNNKKTKEQIYAEVDSIMNNFSIEGGVN